MGAIGEVMGVQKAVAATSSVNTSGIQIESVKLTSGKSIEPNTVSLNEKPMTKMGTGSAHPDNATRIVSINGKAIGYISTGVDGDPTAISLGLKNSSGFFAGTVTQYMGVEVHLPNGDVLGGYTKGSRTDEPGGTLTVLRGKDKGKVVGTIEANGDRGVTSLDISGFGRCLVTAEKFHVIYKSYDQGDRNGTNGAHGDIAGYIKVK